MKKIDLKALLQQLTQVETGVGFQVCISDQSLLPYFLKKILKYKAISSQTWIGKSPCLDLLTNWASGDLFSHPPFGILLPDAKVTEKQLRDDIQAGTKLKGFQGADALLFVPLSLRKSAPDDVPGWLCYNPSQDELAQCALFIWQHYINKKWLPEINIKSQKETLLLAMDHYAHDLLSVVCHLDRMQASGLAFDQAWIHSSQAQVFQITECLARGESEGVVQRVRQCQEAGEDPGAILAATISFLKQVVAVQDLLSQGHPPKIALEQARIPYPSQSKIQMACQRLKSERIFKFLQHAALREVQLRTAKNAYPDLTLALLELLPEA